VSMEPQITRQQTRVATTKHGKAEEGLLIFADGVLVAILTRLSGSLGRDGAALRGRWFLEAGFGPCSVIPGDEQVFDSPDVGQDWVRRRIR
jgi:hypothetical protein